MRCLIGLLFTGIVSLLLGEPASAQWWENKWEVSPFAGYETNGTFTVNPSSTTVNVNKLRANENVSFGSFIDYSVSRGAQVEFMWNRNPTTYSDQQLPNPAYVKAFHADIDQFQFGGLFMFLGSEHKVRPYFAGSVGFTHEFNTGRTANRTDFGFSLGGGVKYYVDRHFGFRTDARWMPTYANSSTEIFCDPFFGCYAARVSHYQHRGNFVGGIIFRF
jgi:hypothetical protein